MLSALFFRKSRKNNIDIVQREKILKKLHALKNHKHEDQYLKKMRFIVFDTETTGFHPYSGDELISIGAVAIENGKIQDEHIFHSYINPNRTIPGHISDLTGIEHHHVESAPSFLSVFSDFLDFKAHSPLIAHCAAFDYNFINVKLKANKIMKLPGKALDTMKLATHLLGDEEKLTLDDLLQQYGIPTTKRHHALEDARMTAHLFIHQIEQLENEGVRTLYELEKFIQYKNNLYQLNQASLNSSF
jgi:DNA polymerase-3 subunit epsilon